MADGLKLRCPGCGFEAELPQFTQAAELLALDRAAAAFGPDWPLVKAYLDCFQGKRPLKAAKLLLLAREVFRIYQSGKFEFNRQWYLVARPEFLAALQTTANQVTPPLANHHYLLRVLTAAARQTSQRREREFREKEKGLGVREEIPPSPPFSKGGDLADLIPPPVDLDDDPVWQAEFFRLGKEARRPGLSPEQREAAGAALRAHIETKKGKTEAHRESKP